jgi:hypothetical protein
MECGVGWFVPLFAFAIYFVGINLGVSLGSRPDESCTNVVGCKIVKSIHVCCLQGTSDPWWNDPPSDEERRGIYCWPNGARDLCAKPWGGLCVVCKKADLCP